MKGPFAFLLSKHGTTHASTAFIVQKKKSPHVRVVPNFQSLFSHDGRSAPLHTRAADRRQALTLKHLSAGAPDLFAAADGL
jgi:hypothetical protein